MWPYSSITFGPRLMNSPATHSTQLTVMPYAFFVHIQIHLAWPGPYTLMSAHNTPPSQ
jgi:hypothetical protein